MSSTNTVSPNTQFKHSNRKRAESFDHIKFRKRLREGSETLLRRYQYQWFITLTCKNQDVSENAARAALEMLINIVNGRLYGHSKYKGKRLKLVAALEQNSSNGYHFHLLIAHGVSPGKLEYPNLIPQYLINTWESRIELAGTNNHWIDAEHRHVSYIAKELPKNEDCLIFDWL